MTSKVDSVFRTRSLGTAASGLTDQYADGKAAKVWQLYIGDTVDRTTNYKDFLIKTLKSKNCKRVLDAACGTGVDSIMVVEEGFEVVSSDASDKMLKTAYKIRWDRRKEPAFDQWVIEEGNWLCLNEQMSEHRGSGFDAIICMGNSFAHLPDFSGDQHDQRTAITNFYELLKPGGILVIDHRNYDYILEHGAAPTKNIAELAIATPQLSTLLAAVKAAGLVDTLAGAGPFTVFAPTNDAFAKVPKDALNALLADKEALTAVLLRHVVPGAALTAQDVPVGSTDVKTAGGEEITVTRDNYIKVKSSAGGAGVVAFDVLATNGVVHLVDTVF